MADPLKIYDRCDHHVHNIRKRRLWGFRLKLEPKKGTSYVLASIANTTSSSVNARANLFIVGTDSGQSVLAKCRNRVEIAPFRTDASEFL